MCTSLCLSRCEAGCIDGGPLSAIVLLLEEEMKARSTVTSPMMKGVRSILLSKEKGNSVAMGINRHQLRRF